MRKADIGRKTTEVNIRGKLNIDGRGDAAVNTGFGPLDHLLTVFAFHGLFDLALDASGDLQHHIIEDIGIAMGKAFKLALGGKEGINRYGCFSAVMDKVVVEADIDISGRPVLHGICPDNCREFLARQSFDDTKFMFKHAEEFLDSFTSHAGISLVYMIKSADGDLHHILEALSKAMGKSLEMASRINPRRGGVPSTKGIID